MRIALFTGNYNYVREGANQALNRLVTYLESAGHAARVYSPVTDTPAFEPAGTLIPVRSIRAPFRGEFRAALGLPRANRRDLRRFAPDLFHVTTPDLLGIRAQSFARRLGVPVVASFHTRFETYLDYYGAGWARGLLEAHLRRFYRRSDLVLVPNQAILAEMSLLVGVERVRLWSRGVDHDLFSPMRRDPQWRRAQGWQDDDVVLLFFGRLVREKGVDAYIETVERLRVLGQDPRPLVIGAGPAAGRFERLSGALLTGHLQDEILARAVASADLLLSASTTEAFGNVVLEAMASGLAVVSADAPSARALIEDGVSGILSPPDPVRYAAVLGPLIEAPERRRKLAAAARAASAAFDWDAASRSVELGYRDLLAGRLRR